MKVLFVIAARGGSKGVPRKNIRKIGGLPLVAYKIIAAEKCRYEHRTIVSTDDSEIAEIAQKYDAEVPFVRPAELASDTASSIDVVLHAIEWVEKTDSNTVYDTVCLLEPSSPFATYEDLNGALSTMDKTGADTVLGMKEVEVSRDFIFGLDDNGGLSLFWESVKKMSGVRRQDQKPQYTLNGCMYIAKMNYFKKNRLFHSYNSRPYIMPWERSVEIDTEQDLKYAEYLISNRVIDLSYWEKG